MGGLRDWKVGRLEHLNTSNKQQEHLNTITLKHNNSKICIIKAITGILHLVSKVPACR